MCEMRDILKKIQYLRLKPEERYLIDILSETTSFCIGYLKEKKKGYVSGATTYYEYNGGVIFDILISDKILTWQHMTINGMERNLKVKSLGWCKYDGFWSEFETKFELDYVQTQALFNKIIGKYYVLELPIFEMETTDTSYKIRLKQYEEKKYIHD